MLLWDVRRLPQALLPKVTGPDGGIVNTDVMPKHEKSEEKNSACFSALLGGKKQILADADGQKQPEHKAELKEPKTSISTEKHSFSPDNEAKQERRRWESNPRNNGFANRRLGPLGYAAKSFFDNDLYKFNFL